MNRALLRHAWRSQRIRLAIVSAALVAWGWLLPVIYARFGSQFRALLDSGMLPDQFATFGGGDVFSLPGAIGLCFIHPIPMILISVFAVGYSSSAVAGERQRGTLEVALARPVSRRGFYVTLLTAAFGFVSTAIAALLAGAIAGSWFAGVLNELAIARLPLVWLNGVLLFGSFAAIGLAASVSFDRFSPSLATTLGIALTMYFFEVLGSLWPDADFMQRYSLFHYLKPKAILTGATAPLDYALLAAVIAAAIAWALLVFPRRDLAAPS